MKIPKKINIMGSQYKIFSQKDLIDEHFKYGICDFKLKHIKYDENLTGDDLQHTIIHEIDHATRFETGIYQAVSCDVLEIIAETTATQFTRLFEMKFKK